MSKEPPKKNVSELEQALGELVHDVYIKDLQIKTLMSQMEKASNQRVVIESYPACDSVLWKFGNYYD